MDRLISLTVRTVGAEDWKHAFDLLCATHAELAAVNDYTSFSSQSMMHPTDDLPICDNIAHEDLFVDANTMTKFIKVLRENGVAYQKIDAIVNDLTAHGLLLRERVPRDNGSASAQSDS